MRRDSINLSVFYIQKINIYKYLIKLMFISNIHLLFNKIQTVVHVLCLMPPDITYWYMRLTIVTTVHRGICQLSPHSNFQYVRVRARVYVCGGLNYFAAKSTSVILS